VAEACGDSHHFPMAAFKLLLDVTYLTRLLRIKSILTGVGSALVLIPLSTKLSKKHRTLQAELSRAHDDLSNCILEALQGLRQIRMSSMEQIWEARILNLRTRELDHIWRTGVNLAFMTLVANLGPILLASVALSAYSIETGHLSPSVAFASLSLFDNLDEVFRELPLMAANLHDSWISCQRIQRYLEEPEQLPNSIPSDHVFLEDANLTWPGRTRSSPLPVFELRDVNLVFPRGKLSIITGKTGSGKGLLITALLEEAKIESGRFGKPAPMASLERGLMSDKSYIGTTALVSQPPWIENCTVKDNILFGYQFDEARYRKVLYSCALNQDLNSFPNGDLTKAGVNGAVLSGGQKWRVALARALYSPAETLIFEDILSAVDAPVARWICDNALRGDLVEGRTRIVVTHNPELCIATASYLVVVQDGTAKGKSKSEASIIEKGNTSSDEFTEFTAEAVAVPEGSSKATIKGNGNSQQIASRDIWETFSTYLRVCGGIRAYILGLLVTLSYQVSSASHSWWLARWTAPQEIAKNMMIYNIGVYLILSIGNGIAVAVQSLVFTSIGHVASRSLFQQMVHSVLAAPLGW
jgi:ABC-type multidrug transport system fused ATPase/permease subunit